MGAFRSLSAFPAPRSSVGATCKSHSQISPLGHSTNGEFDTSSVPAMLSFPPCADRAVDGIFPPGGGGPRTDSKTSGRTCRLGKIGHARGDFALMADGGNVIGR